MLIMLGQTFSKSLLLLDYRWNKDYIARNLCVNRDKPKMKCEGRCYLCKKLKEDANKDQENPERRVNDSPDLISLRVIYLLTPPFSSSILTSYPLFQERVNNRCADPFFHPPQV